MKTTKKEDQKLLKNKMFLTHSTCFGNNPYDFKYKLCYTGSNACYYESNSQIEIKRIIREL